jgi:hypothetical protein
MLLVLILFKAIFLRVLIVNIVNAKIHGLREIFKRLDSKTLPMPTGNDVANYLQWFQDVLQG